MLTLADLFRAHGGELPEGGFTAEEVWATNRMTPAEWSLAMDAEREARRAFLAAGRESDEDRRYRELRAATVAAGVPERYASGAIDSRYVRAMASGRGLWLYGDVGTGKTHMASALCVLACQERLEARFFTASSLVMRLRRARDEGRLDHEAAQIGRARLLVVDELGFLPLDADGARPLFQVFSDAYERQSVVITTNLEFSRWGAVFGDDQMAAAVIDRVVHHGRLLQFRGESYRVRHALMQG